MTKEEILEIFDLLESEFNKNSLFYFVWEENNQIGAYFKSNDKRFARFYLKNILTLLQDKEMK